MKIKRAISVILCFLLLPVFCHAAKTEIIFDSESALASVICTDGEMSYADGKLYFKAAPTYPPLSTVSAESDIGTSEYFYSVRFSFITAVSQSSFFALRFGATDAGEYRLSVSLDSQLELCYAGGDGTYTSIASDTLSSYKGAALDPTKFDGADIATGHYITLAVSVKDSYAYIYADGVMIGESPLPHSASGDIGFCGKGAEFYVTSLSQTTQLPQIQSISSSYDTDVNDISQDLSSPFVIFKNDTASVTQPYTDSQRACCVCFSVSALDGVLYVYSNGNNLGTLKDRFALYDRYAIPAFSVSDAQSAELLSDFLDENSIYDAFVVSSDENILKTCLGTGKNRRGVLDVSSFSSADASALAHRLYSNSLRTVILSESAADPDTVYALRCRMITVYVRADESLSSVYDSIACGADGVFTDYATEAADMILSLPDGVLNKQSAAFIECKSIDDVTLASQIGAPGVYGELTVNEGICHLGNEPLSEIYASLPENGRVIYCIYRGSDRSVIDALWDFCAENSASSDVFLLAPLQTAKYAGTLDGLNAHVLGSFTPSDDKTVSRYIFEIENSLRSLNASYVTETELDKNFIAACAARGLNISSLGLTDAGFDSPYACIFTSTPEIYTGAVKYMTLTVDNSTPSVICVGYDGNTFLPSGTFSPSYTDGSVSYGLGRVNGEGCFAMQVQNTHIYLSCAVSVGNTTEHTEAITQPVSDGDGTFLSDASVTATVAVSVLAVAAGFVIYLLLRKNKR